MASPVAASQARIPAGVPPLRAGEGNSFLWRRLHSLTGIVPIGAFLVEHFISNAMATNGPQAYGDQVKFLTGLPFTFALELVFIYIPLAYHALYGIYIWYRGEGNVVEYPWTGNWLYTSQRWTGIIALIYMGYHIYTMRFSGVHLFHGGYVYAFGKVNSELMNPVDRGVLCGWNYCRVVALCVWNLAVRGQVGHHRRPAGAAQIRLCLRVHCLGVHAGRRAFAEGVCQSRQRLALVQTWAGLP